MPSQPAPILTADSITRIGPEAKGAVVVNGSHGGVYAAYVAAKLGVAAAIFNDAGVGRDQAGIAGLDYLAELGIPAAAVGHMTARIGDGADMMARGRHHPCESAWRRHSAAARASPAVTPPPRWRKHPQPGGSRRRRSNRRFC